MGAGGPGLRCAILLLRHDCGVTRSSSPQSLTQYTCRADPELQLFEDAICLTFLQTEFSSFASSFQHPTAPPPTSDKPPLTPDERRAKLVRIVAKTWAKMTHNGRQVAVEQLVGGLSDELRAVVMDAVIQAEENKAA